MVRAISNSNDSTSGSEIHFTIESATQMLPLVRRIVDDLLRLNDSIVTQRQQLQGIDQLSQTIDQADYREELSDVRRSLDADQQHFDAYLRELTTLGIEPHLPFDGSLDFPSEINRRRVLLCWRPGDNQVDHWHELGESTDERKQV